MPDEDCNETDSATPAAESNHDGSEGGRKRHRPLFSDARYPRKRSSKACHVCRARKTKCDNVRPTCGFCASVNIQCSYDVADKDHSSFDPASLEILRQLAQLSNSQEEVLQIIRSISATQSGCLPSLPPPTPALNHASVGDLQHDASWPDPRDDVHQHRQQLPFMTHDGYVPQPESASTTPAASAAAARWFDLLTNDAREAYEEADAALGNDGGFLEPEDLDEDSWTALQRATRIVDCHPLSPELRNDGISPSNTAVDVTGAEETMWRAPETIRLLDREQVLFEIFLRRICSWLDLFDPASTFSTRVPHLAVRNAGLLNAILALSSYHQSLDETIAPASRPDQNTALQYYYQTLHYVQKAMRYPTYQNSQELMATTLIVSTYEMLRGSRRDWQQHLQGVFWILRSRQIEVEAPGLESTTWWAWLRQDIWVAFRERRKTYSTWAPKRGYAQLGSYEVASRAVWILAQVVNFCAVDAYEGEGGAALEGRMEWAGMLEKMLLEWKSHLTVEFSPLPAMSRQDAEVFQPRLIHPQCFGLSMQIHHVSQILLCAHKPCLGGLEAFIKRQKKIQDNIEVVCGIGMTLTEDASSMVSSQCMFIAGIFMQDPAQRRCVLEMLDSCRARCGWPTPSLGSELERIWEDPDAAWGSLHS